MQHNKNSLQHPQVSRPMASYPIYVTAHRVPPCPPHASSCLLRCTVWCCTCSPSSLVWGLLPFHVLMPQGIGGSKILNMIFKEWKIKTHFYLKNGALLIAYGE